MGKQLSKSKLLAFRQCPKRLWLEVHHPDLCEDSVASQARFAIGNTVGDIARHAYDPEGRGVLLDAQTDGYAPTFARTQALLAGTQPIFEAGFQIGGALAFVDVMLPAGEAAWRMVEVKSSTEVKPYHRDDAAIQSYVARASGANLAGIAVAHIDNDWVYPGDGDYAGLLKEEDLTSEAFAREGEVRSWLQEAQRVVASEQEPQVALGEQCRKPFECGFLAYCQRNLPVAEALASQLPKPSKKLKTWLANNDVIELAEVPDHLLNARQLRVKRAVLSGEAYFNREGACSALAGHALPAYFMDFETYQFAVPIWKGTRPYQMIPFQYSVHRLDEDGALEHHGFLDLSGNDPSLAFATRLIEECGSSGPIYVYNAGFENSRIKELAVRFPALAPKLLALVARVVDLLPIAREHFYHPSQMGSWSIKKVLPAACPDDPSLDYANLEGVQHGGAAMDAFAEAIHPDTTSERKTEIERQLIAYCKLDTLAMVRLWGVFGGKKKRGMEQEMTNIENFKFNTEQTLDGFELLLENVDLNNREVSYGKAKKILSKSVSGIYFWVMRWNGSSYRIYIGKSVSIVGRLSNYTSKFGSLSPSNYKMRYFQHFMRETFPGSTLDLYYQKHQLTSKELHEPEKALIYRFDPLINQLETSVDSQHLMQEEFRSLYESSFKRVLARP